MAARLRLSPHYSALAQSIAQPGFRSRKSSKSRKLPNVTQGWQQATMTTKFAKASAFLGVWTLTLVSMVCHLNIKCDLAKHLGRLKFVFGDSEVWMWMQRPFLVAQVLPPLSSPGIRRDRCDLPTLGFEV